MNALINNTVEVIVPDGMHLLSEDEKNQFFADSRIRNEDNWCVRSEENHSYINICYKKRPLLLGRLASLEAQRDATEKKISGMIPGYEKLGHGEKTIDGVKVCTFRFRYTRDSITQYCEYDLCIKGNYFYGIQLAYREGYRDFAEKSFEELIRSIRFQ